MVAGRLEGKVAVVTGGGRGTGRSVALLLAEEGASVVVNDLGCDIDGTGSSHVPADQVVEEVRCKGGRAVPNYDDVALMAGGENFVETAVGAYGRLDILVNSVVVMRDRMIHQTTPEEFDQVIRSHLKGTFVPTKYAAIHFRQQRSGRIVNMTSDAGLGSIGRSSYAASSEAIIGLTRTVARDMGRYGVTCNAVSPGPETGRLPKTTKGRGGQDRYDDPEDVAPLAVFLCTDTVPPDVNGYVFGYSGGSIFLYSNPSIERSLHKWGAFTMDEMDALVPSMIETEA